METAGYLPALRRETDAFRGALLGDLAARVEHCGSWTLYDLASHLGAGHRRAATAITGRHPGHRSPAAPRDRAALLRWFDRRTADLLAALDADPAAPAWTFHPPHTVGFWQRRRCLETLVHRWDAQHALGAVPDPMDPELAADGIAEVLDTFAPRQIAVGRAAAPACAVLFEATDTGSSWTYGPGTPAAGVTGTAAELLLTLWGRRSADGAGLVWKGDREAASSVLAGPLVA
ncbi:maleylpyruvate isomerase family mycothiol-dependent enzyme [Actinacidiphila paucisporea]|uniref:TIGR03083 family protein n=1 Tax=Actinacidiphila paucisporea TaxID=310782 RepID=A0A1M7ADG8_9ACTN|nr:maleylpyruvate isomerase family mycothiol-dependent enzyme [Actinacidiphila paucisporea]SHL40750.1 TIGR03083 family protein [Actinacidiphila paucisporea]